MGSGEERQAAGGRGSGGGLVLLDACCLINLFATGRAEELLAGLPYELAVSGYVAADEVLEIDSIQPDEAGDPVAQEHPRLALRPLISDLADRGVLELMNLETAEEERELVRFARDLDDGEAHTAALAVTRGARVATDDRKAIRVLRAAWRERGDTGDPILRTSQLLFPWAEALGLADDELARLLRDVARRASFFPPRDDPHVQRWMELLQRTD